MTGLPSPGLAWGAVLAVARRELRLRWVALVAIGVLAGLAGAAAAGGVAVARRTTSAHSRLIAASGQEDARILSFGGQSTAQVAALPSVAASWSSSAVVAKLLSGNLAYVGIVSGPPRPPGLITPVVLEGRMPHDDDPGEVAVDRAYLRAFGFHVGDTLRLKALTRQEVFDFDKGFGEPDGPALSLRVVGSLLLPSSGNGIGPAWASSAFNARYADLSPGGTQFLRLRPGAAVSELERELAQVSSDAPADAAEFGPLRVVTPESTDDPSVAAAQRAAAVGLGTFAAVALLAGLLATWQGLARHWAAGGEDQRVEAALGLTAGERALARTLPALAGAAAAGALTVGGTLAAGLLEPVGRLADVEPAPGWRPDLAVALVGGCVAVLVVAALAGASAWRAGSAPQSSAAGTSTVRGGVLALVRPAWALAGGAFATRRAAGRTRVPVRLTFVSAGLAVAGIVASATFAASLHRLDSTPARYGVFADFYYADAQPTDLVRLAADRHVGTLVLERATTVSVEGRFATAYSDEVRKGDLHVTTLEGREPRTRREVALGPRLAGDLGARVGSTVRLTPPGGRPLEFRVVGLVLYPDQQAAPLGENLLLTTPGLTDAQTSPPTLGAYVEAARPADLPALWADYGRTLELTSAGQPEQVSNVTGLAGVPTALVVFLAALGAGALTHALVLLTRRRARDLAVLRALGLAPREVALTVVAAALVIATAALVVGVPLGLLVGRVLWSQTAGTVGVATDTAWPGVALLVLVPAAVTGSVLVALLTARRVTSQRASVALREE
ncbi:ABC-type lipoprotein release transport system permease subunit [Motilibacter peucedani]|uniref:ABC-type lipoprotein release transport system permease subunit n=1 Tax=Motilibacter peucedani TaxID=598650 RepID=A0A420XUW2_9ACTN|nr:FtsX-like permease family protein [Motilibacter peucedani]RKS80530.1 ABC-type lipoprotein release transport system permease subunit [Motilibacter peucedani]